MKKRFTYIGTAMLSALLCCLMLFGAALPAAAQSTPDALPSLDYGIVGRGDNVTLSPTELYDRLFAEEPTAAEALYLETTGISMTYNSLIPDNRLITSYNAEAGVLSVTVLPYTYTAANGATVTWTPTSAYIGGKALTLTAADEGYSARVENLFFSDDFDMRVDYAWSVEIPAEIIETLRCAAYEKGSEALGVLTAYEEAYAAYCAHLNAHNAWVAYDTWYREIWQVWEAEDAAYRVEKDKFDTYKRAYAQYEKECALYYAWQDFYAYPAKAEAYAAYQTYLLNRQPAIKVLGLLESLFVADSHGWQLYNSIMGGTVDQVLAREKELYAAAVPREVIRLAGSSTEELRKILPKYAAIRTAKYNTEHDRYVAMFDFYQKHYTELATHFEGLYSSLRDLFQHSIVALKIHDFGKTEHFVQFVGQLYVVTSCLYQKNQLDLNWTIDYSGKADKKLPKVVEAVHLLEDGDWDPTNKKMPAYVPYAEKPAPATRPEGSQITELPSPPMPIVPDPGDGPAKPDNPYAEGVPTYAAHPGDAPIAPQFDSITQALLDEVKSGALTAYTGAIEPIVLPFEISFETIVSIRNLKKVSFYDVNGNLIKLETVDYGASLYLPVPELEPTAQYFFVPQGWNAVDGSVVNLAYVTDHLSLVPAYTKILRHYDITWRFGDEVEVVRLPYGSTPKPPAKWSLTTYDHAHYRYTFSGWDKPVGVVTGDASYSGEMIKTLLSYRVTWILYDGVTVTEEWPALSAPIFSGSTDRAPDHSVYTFKGWIGPVGVLTGDATYRAHYESTRLVSGAAGEQPTVVHKDSVLEILSAQSSLDIVNAVRYALGNHKALSVKWENGVAMHMNVEQLEAFGASVCRRIILECTDVDGVVCYKLRFCDAAWNDMPAVGAGVGISLPAYTDGDKTAVYYLKTADGMMPIDGMETVLTGSATIVTAYSYRLTLNENPECDMGALQKSALAGERVSLKIRCQWGYEVVAATVTLPDGTAVAVDEDLSFIMPNSPVTVTLTTAKIQYTVTFIVNGEVYHSAVYDMGDDIFIPADPTLPAKNGYVYVFTGWGELPAVAVGSVRDIVLEASFVLAKENVDYSTGRNTNILFELYIPLFCILLVGGIVLLIILRRRKRRRAASQSAAAEQTGAETATVDKGSENPEP